MYAFIIPGRGLNTKFRPLLFADFSYGVMSDFLMKVFETTTEYPFERSLSDRLKHLA